MTQRNITLQCQIFMISSGDLLGVTSLVLMPLGITYLGRPHGGIWGTEVLVGPQLG